MTWLFVLQEMERKEEEERIRTENLLRGNPLLNQQKGASFKIKRRWDDDVVFKNCAKAEPKASVSGGFMQSNDAVIMIGVEYFKLGPYFK